MGMSKTVHSTLKQLKNYSRRFSPSLMSHLKSSRRREVTTTSDKITSDEALTETVYKFLSHLDKKMCESVESQNIMRTVLGYSINRASSRIPGAGEGVILSAGNAQRGDVIALYPGTVYRRFEPIFLPSIGNQFVLRCVDGIHIDGNDKYLSKIIFKSCVGRDSMFPLKAADITWLTRKPKVAWNIGQYVNNGTQEYPANVAYQELDLYNFPLSLSYLIPNIWYSGINEKHIRIVVLVATRSIQEGEEVLSNYYTIVHV